MAEDSNGTELARLRTALLLSLKVPSPFPVCGLPTFITDATDFEVSLIDSNTFTTTPAKPLVIKDEEQFKQHITTRPEQQLRIISIHSRNSIMPLLITQSAMQTLLDWYYIGEEFLDLVHSFGRKPHISDAGHGRMTVHRRRSGAYDIQYLLPYVESYVRDDTTMFTTRWVGVFHRFSPEGAGQNLWIFLHVKQNSEVQQRIYSALRQTLDAGKHPSFLHLVTLSSYIGNWRLFIQSVGEKVEKMADWVVVAGFDKKTSPDDALKSLQNLSDLRDELLPLKPRIKVTHQVLSTLKQMNIDVNTKAGPPNSDRQSTNDLLTFYLERVEGHLQSIQLLEDKLQGTLNLLEVAVDLGNRNQTGQINERMLQLTSHAVDDSAAVRVITFFTMLYLPPSFVSTFLGMDIFKFDGSNTSTGVAISKGFWLFFAFCIPLSAGTFFAWKVFWKKQRQKRQQSGVDPEKDI